MAVVLVIAVRLLYIYISYICYFFLLCQFRKKSLKGKNKRKGGEMIREKMDKQEEKG